MRASHLSLVATAPLPAHRAAAKPAPVQGAAAFLEALEHVMKQARDIAGAADQAADLRATCADFLRRNAEVAEDLAKVTWLASRRSAVEDDLDLQLEPFIGA